MKFNFLIALAALTAGAIATTNADCQNSFDTCRSSGDPNEAACASAHASCCAKAFDTCRSSGDPNEAECAAENAACKGQK